MAHGLDRALAQGMLHDASRLKFESAVENAFSQHNACVVLADNDRGGSHQFVAESRRCSLMLKAFHPARHTFDLLSVVRPMFHRDLDPLSRCQRHRKLGVGVPFPLGEEQALPSLLASLAIGVTTWEASRSRRASSSVQHDEKAAFYFPLLFKGSFLQPLDEMRRIGTLDRLRPETHSAQCMHRLCIVQLARALICVWRRFVLSIGALTARSSSSLAADTASLASACAPCLGLGSGLGLGSLLGVGWPNPHPRSSPSALAHTHTHTLTLTLTHTLHLKQARCACFDDVAVDGSAFNILSRRTRSRVRVAAHRTALITNMCMSYMHAYSCAHAHMVAAHRTALITKMRERPSPPPPPTLTLTLNPTPTRKMRFAAFRTALVTKMRERAALSRALPPLPPLPPPFHVHHVLTRRIVIIRFAAMPHLANQVTLATPGPSLALAQALAL